MAAFVLLIAAAVSAWPRVDTEPPAEFFSLTLAGGVDQETGEWCLNELSRHLDNPDEMVWLSGKVVQDTAPPPAPWLVAVIASYRAPNRAGATQKFNVDAGFVEDDPTGETGLRLIRIRHNPPLPGVDFVSAR